MREEEAGGFLLTSNMNNKGLIAENNTHRAVFTPIVWLPGLKPEGKIESLLPFTLSLFSPHTDS